MSNSSFEIKKYADLPNNVLVSQKDGFWYTQNESYFHDCGILYVSESRFSYCIMTKGLDKVNATKVIGTIVNKSYSFINEQGVGS